MLNAADVMTTPVIYVMSETPVKEIAGILLRHGISAVPVVEDSGRVVGIVSEGDLVLHAAPRGRERRPWWLDIIEKSSERSEGLQNYLDRHGLRAKDVMSEAVITVAHDTPITAVADVLQRNKIKRVPVMRAGQMVGIVSRANLLAALARMRPDAG